MIDQHASPCQPNLGIGIRLNDPMKHKCIGKPVIAVDGDADIVIGNLRTREHVKVRADMVELAGMIDNDNPIVAFGQSGSQPVRPVGAPVVQDIASPVADGLLRDRANTFADKRQSIVKRCQDSQHARLFARLS
jgi:hypothetical protein